MWKYSQRTLRDSRIISLASVASMFIEARGGYLNSSITTDMLNFIELAYHGGRLEVLKPGYWGTVGYYDFKLMYGSLLLEALPVSLRWAHLPDITSQGFYDITFTGGGASAASVLPIRGPSVTYAKEGRGVY